MWNGNHERDRAPSRFIPAASAEPVAMWPTRAFIAQCRAADDAAAFARHAEYANGRAMLIVETIGATAGAVAYSVAMTEGGMVYRLSAPGSCLPVEREAAWPPYK